MNQQAEHTQECQACGAHFVTPNAGRPPKFCCSACRVKHHRLVHVTKPVTKASPAFEKHNRIALVQSVLRAYRKLDEAGRHLVRCELKEELEALERQTTVESVGHIQSAIINLSDDEFLAVKRWINQGAAEAA